MIYVNGKHYEEQEISLIAMLEKLEVKQDRIVVEINEKIIPKEAYDQVWLKDDDHMEVVRFVGGG